jgi:hypothetical protein
MASIKCSWWEYTDKRTPFVDGISSPIMRSLETGEEVSSRDLPVGALYAGKGHPDYPYPKGPDDLTIFCRVPDAHGHHSWIIDGRASNCTMPDDNEHRCWIRHGTVGELLTVDKNGHTCAAGAGSILTSNWHGFLRNGYLEG